MQHSYKDWLQLEKYAENTVNVQIYRVGRVEEFYGDLDLHYDQDRLAQVVAALRYTTDDKRHGLPNPSLIPFQGDIQSNLASYRNAVERYRRFRDTSDGTVAIDQGSNVQTARRSPTVETNEELGARVGLERDMQAALRLTIEQLEPGLTIIDDGAERSVDSGFIDITASDTNGAIVVIELKTGVAGQRAVAQLLSYMGDITNEEPDKLIRGILIASDFDHKAIAAARMVPSLSLHKYGIRFNFSELKP